MYDLANDGRSITFVSKTQVPSAGGNAIAVSGDHVLHNTSANTIEAYPRALLDSSSTNNIARASWRGSMYFIQGSIGPLGLTVRNRILYMSTYNRARVLAFEIPQNMPVDIPAADRARVVLQRRADLEFERDIDTTQTLAVEGSDFYTLFPLKKISPIDTVSNPQVQANMVGEKIEWVSDSDFITFSGVFGARRYTIA